MNARYYVRKKDGTTEGPFPTWTAATERIAGWHIRSIFDRPGDHAVLLDEASLDVVGIEEIRALLLHDPLLNAVFQLGRQYEGTRLMEARRDH